MVGVGLCRGNDVIALAKVLGIHKKASGPKTIIMKIIKQKILASISLIIIFCIIAYTWGVILFTDILATWRHYVGLILFIPLPWLLIKNVKLAIKATGIYLILGILNLLTLTPDIVGNTFGIGQGSLQLSTPSFNLLSFGLFVLYCILNFETLVNMYLDYREQKQKKV
jgi:hypothetical protein